MNTINEQNTSRFDVATASKKQAWKRNTARWVLTAAVLLWFSILIIFPLWGIIRETVKSDLAAFVTSLSTPSSLHSFRLTLVITAAAVGVNTVLGTVLAVVFARQDFKGKLFMESLIDLPFAVSPVAAGFMFILLFGPNGWIGRWFESMNIKIIYALPGMVIATLFVTLPFVAREILPILREFGREQEEAAATLGASEWQIFRRVTLPSIKWGLAYGVTLTIARSIGEFGAVLVVSGSIINKTQTATLMIHDQFTSFNYAGAFSAALVMAVVSFVILNVIHFLYERKEKNDEKAGEVS